MFFQLSKTLGLIKTSKLENKMSTTIQCDLNLCNPYQFAQAVIKFTGRATREDEYLLDLVEEGQKRVYATIRNGLVTITQEQTSRPLFQSDNKNASDIYNFFLTWDRTRK